LFLLTANFCQNFHPEKYDFNLHKGFSMEKNGSNSTDFKEKKIPNHQIFNDKFE
jgi:hypothetical protein